MKKIVSFVFLTGFLALLVFSTGCSLCCAPYDYCGPIFADGHCANLARQRCGTAFNGGCASCGMHGNQVAYDQNGQPIPTQGTVQQQPTPVPASTVPAAPIQPQSQIQPQDPTQALPAPLSQNTSMPQYMNASSANTTVTPSEVQEMPQNGSIAVGADGLARVAVYDENNQLLGYEMVDSTGKSISQVAAPESVH